MSSINDQFLPWLRAARPVAHGMIALPLLWGQALAWLFTGQFHCLWFLLIHIYGAACQVYILYLNDYADEAVDRLNSTYWFSGGSRVIAEGQLSGEQLYQASFIALAGMAFIGVLSASAGRPWMLLLVGISAFAAWNYSLKPLQSSYRGYGEAHQGLSCGVLLPITAFYLQSGSLEQFPWLALIPLFLIFFAGNIITALLDFPSDAEGGKLTYPVRHNEKKARRDALLLLVVAYLFSIIFCMTMTGDRIALQFLAGLVGAPALGLLAYVARTGLLQHADISNQPACKKFVVLTTASQAWVMVTWTGSIFYLGFM